MIGGKGTLDTFKVNMQAFVHAKGKKLKKWEKERKENIEFCCSLF